MVEQLRPEDVARRLSEHPEGIVLLDVREDWERTTARIEPSLHIPMQQVPDRLGELPKRGLIVVYCHSGVRSAMVAAYLAGHGFRSVANLSGGIDAWSTELDATIPRY
ncbi:MAG TPA: rhodanese-like domain-containing protein [Thermoplasmata archaeon]|nr:rhodanese-like domain-containing protein [Thermoplasmata archaeon]